MVGEQYLINYYANKIVVEAFEDGCLATNAPERISTETSFQPFIFRISNVRDVGGFGEVATRRRIC